MNIQRISIHLQIRLSANHFHLAQIYIFNENFTIIYRKKGTSSSFKFLQTELKKKVYKFKIFIFSGN